MLNLTYKQKDLIKSRVSNLEMEAKRYDIRAGLIDDVLDDYINNNIPDIDCSNDDFILDLIGDLTYLLDSGSDSELVNLLIKDELKYCPYILVKNPDYIPPTLI